MKNVFLFLCILCATNSYAQPFASFEGTTKGFGLSVGFKDETGIQAASGYNVSIFNKTKTYMFYGSAGYNIYLGSESSFALLPSVGVANLFVVRITDKYDAITTKSVKPVYGLELGKIMHMGRLFVSANKCNTMYYGLGIKVFID